LQEKKIWVLELVPMDLLDKVKEIAMIYLSILYDTNPVPLSISTLNPIVDPKQQGSSVEEELQEADTSIPTRRKKKKRKAACKVVIKKMSMGM
jgi:hypothetical protein